MGKEKEENRNEEQKKALNQVDGMSPESLTAPELKEKEENEHLGIL